MDRHSCYRTLCGTIVVLMLAWIGVQSGLAAERPATGGGAGPADPPRNYRGKQAPLTGPSIVKDQSPGIDVGKYPPDFKLQPIQPYADLKKWLGDKAPKTAEDLVPLSDFVGKAPIILLFGSYT